jgi:hypothetical protein
MPNMPNIPDDSRCDLDLDQNSLLQCLQCDRNVVAGAAKTGSPAAYTAGPLTLTLT